MKETPEQLMAVMKYGMRGTVIGLNGEVYAKFDTLSIDFMTQEAVFTSNGVEVFSVGGFGRMNGADTLNIKMDGAIQLKTTT